MSSPLIVSLLLDRALQEHLDALRRAHFPPHRLTVGAHVTLLHAVPGERRGELDDALAGLGPRAQFPVTVGPAYSLGRGAALRVRSAALAQVRGELAAALREWLTPQDAQPYRAHVTVANKQTAAAARATLAELMGLPELSGTARGLAVWHYAGGPWLPAGEHPFAADDLNPASPH